MRNIVVYENSICDIGATDVALIDTLLKMSSNIKESLGLPYYPFQFDTGTKLHVERVIGSISLNDVSLSILPKICRDNQSINDVHGLLKAFLLRTLKCAGDKFGSIIFFTKNSLIDDQEVLLSVLAQYYYESLSRAMKLSTISTFESVEQRSAAIKGRILVRKQLSQPMNDAKIWCRYKKMSTDNPYNTLLSWAGVFLASSIHEASLKKKLSQLIKDLGIQTNELSHSIVSSLRLPRQFTIYRECFSVARNLYLNEFGKKEAGIGKHMCGYIISTERAFERIVECYCNKAAQHLGYGHRAQAAIRLAESSSGTDYDYYIIPDDLVFTKEKRLIIDAKYKLLQARGTRNKPLREDIYQMISSCIAHNAAEAILVYPKAQGAVPISWTVIEKINGKNYVIHSAFVDVFESDELLLRGLMRMLEKTSFSGVSA